jgi:catalase
MTLCRVAVIAAVMGLGAASHVAAQEALESQILAALDQAFGLYQGFRPNHAKGVVVEGRFTATPEAKALSKAKLFDGGPTPVTGRFSDSTGIPDLPDGSPFANPHGMAVKFKQADGVESDMVLVSLKTFPVATGEDFRDMFMAIAKSPPDAAKPTAFDQFLAAHPAAPPAFASAATPDSFADEEYRSLSAFMLVNADGKRQPVRFIMAPEKLVHLDPADAAKRNRNFLFTDLAERLKAGPVTFHLKAQLAQPGDPTNDATKGWPAERQVVELGTLTLDKIVPDSAAAEKALLFLPGQLADGIETSDDPLTAIRDSTYAASFSRRSE